MFLVESFSLVLKISSKLCNWFASIAFRLADISILVSNSDWNVILFLDLHDSFAHLGIYFDPDPLTHDLLSHVALMVSSLCNFETSWGKKVGALVNGSRGIESSAAIVYPHFFALRILVMKKPLLIPFACINLTLIVSNHPLQNAFFNCWVRKSFIIQLQNPLVSISINPNSFALERVIIELKYPLIAISVLINYSWHRVRDLLREGVH